MSRKWAVLFSVLLMGGMLFAGGRSGGGGTITLKAATNQRMDHPWNQGLEKMRKELESISGGTMTIDLYTDGVLGGEAELLESVRGGTVDLVVADPSLGSSFARELDLFALPFLFRDYEHWKRVLDGPIGAEYAKLIEEKTGLRILGYWGGSVRNVISVKAPVRTINDLQGFKLRLAPSDLKFKVWTAVGASPTPIEFTETYSALQAGVVDGMENEYPSILQSKFYEPAHFFTKTEHEITVRPLFANGKKLDALTEEQRDAVMKAAAIATTYARELERQAGLDARKEMVEKYGVQEFDIDKEPIKKRVAPVFAEFGSEYGLTDIINQITAG